MTLTVDAIRECLEGGLPSLAATCAPDGTPNVTYVSQVHYVDATHVALTYQFFSKTRENVLANPRVVLYLMHPVTLARYRVAAQYLRTETEGPLFESMKAKLAGIASHTGMAGVFRLLGSDVYRVLEIESVPGRQRPALPPGRSLLAAVRRAAQRLAGLRRPRGAARRGAREPRGRVRHRSRHGAHARRAGTNGSTRLRAAGTNRPASVRRSPSGRA